MSSTRHDSKVGEGRSRCCVGGVGVVYIVSVAIASCLNSSREQCRGGMCRWRRRGSSGVKEHVRKHGRFLSIVVFGTMR